MSNTPFLRRGALVGLLLLSAACLTAQAVSKVRFTDPTKPGTLKIHIKGGDLRITPGSEAGLVRVQSEGSSEQKAATREDGLRVLGDTEMPFSLSVEGNAAELRSNREIWAGDKELAISVPADTALEIQTEWGGDIHVTGLSGALAIQGMNNDIELWDHAGAINIETMNSDIHASLASLSPEKPVSISSMNGTVVLRVPADGKANVRFRTHNGAILTDFSEEQLKTKSEDVSGSWGSSAGRHVVMATTLAREISRHISGQARDISEEVNKTIQEVREARQARQARLAEQAKEEKAGAESIKGQAPALPEGPEKNTAQPPAPAAAPKPPAPPSRHNIPALSGGKVVSGALNEGGVSIQVTLMNGDITFRKAEKAGAKP